MVKLLSLILFLIILVGIGVGCLFFAQKVQTLAIKCADMGLSAKISLIKRFVISDYYLFTLRIIGGIALVTAVFFGWMLLKNL